MNQPNATAPAPDLLHDLRAFVGVCEELLQLSVREHQALNGGGKFAPEEFGGTRKDLLARLNQVLISVKNWRKAWQKENPAPGNRSPEVKALLDGLQQMIVKILQLDRENQQALLRRGLLPAREVPSYAPATSSFVSRLYSRHTS